jgi:C-methyltransferase C-terminal domain
MKIIGYSAAAKENTLLNYCGIKGNDLIEFVVDASPYRQNKLLPGSRNPVVGKEKIDEYQPNFVIIFPWNLKEEVMNQLTEIKDWGGRLVIAIPELTIL